MRTLKEVEKSRALKRILDKIPISLYQENDEPITRDPAKSRAA